MRSLRLVGVNPAAERELRAPLGFALGKPITDCFPKLLDTSVPESCRQVVLSGKPEPLGEFTYHDTRIPEGIFWADGFPLPDRCVGVALENITERKRLIENQHRALQLLHRVTVFLSDAATVFDAAQYCVDEICTQIRWPVGRFFLADETSPSRFLPNPVWHFSDADRFRAFRKTTELYELDLSNKLALEYRTLQGQRAGLTRSVGFSVVENDFLRGVLEFSSEDFVPLDEHVFRAISNIGYQLGHVFARERLAREYHYVPEPKVPRGVHQGMAKGLFLQESLKAAVVASLEAGNRTRQVIANSSNGVREAISEMREQLEELRRLTANRIEIPPIAGL